MTTRDDPLGRRALFGPLPDLTLPSVDTSPVDTSPVDTAPDAGAETRLPETRVEDQGRRAFFTEVTPIVPTPRPSVRVTCRSCRVDTDLRPAQALRALIGSLWWPLGAWNHRMRCPACGRVGWCRISWDGMIDWR